jgi:hypothetical protein
LTKRKKGNIYILLPYGKWEKLMESDPLMTKIREGKIKKAGFLISAGIPLPKGIGPGRYFAMVQIVPADKDDIVWREITDSVVMV